MFESAHRSSPFSQRRRPSGRKPPVMASKDFFVLQCASTDRRSILWAIVVAFPARAKSTAICDHAVR